MYSAQLKSIKQSFEVTQHTKCPVIYHCFLGPLQSFPSTSIQYIRDITNCLSPSWVERKSNRHNFKEREGVVPRLSHNGFSANVVSSEPLSVFLFS